jgi:hypothetical protein
MAPGQMGGARPREIVIANKRAIGHAKDVSDIEGL